MQGTEFDEHAFFQAVTAEGRRILLIGRRAMVLLGLPVLTADYDFWLHPDDIEGLNRAAAPFGMEPTLPPSEARRRGRYVLENDEHVDVMVVRSVTTVDGAAVGFDDLWATRRTLWLDDHVFVHMPNLDGMLQTKRFASRPKDLEDLRLLNTLKEEEGEHEST